ncbi:unnamed protein product [Effrenium voratum]|uniref:Uncharacterized protein n=1 Tax=Effrenium voratum TaxID=2562239 RepID=A0AA36JIN9_9DINO|nr:unnamed protein product [Effrenium voratum]
MMPRSSTPLNTYSVTPPSCQRLHLPAADRSHTSVDFREPLKPALRKYQAASCAGLVSCQDGKHHATGPSSKSKAPDESKSKKEVEADRPVSILKRPSARREEPSIEKPSIEKSSMEKRYVVRGSVGLGQSARIGEIMKKEELMSLCKTKQKKDKLEAHFKDPLRLQEVYVAIG